MLFDGLDEMDKRMLRVMAENYRGGPGGMSTIAVAVGEEAETLEEVLALDGAARARAREASGVVAA